MPLTQITDNLSIDLDEVRYVERFSDRGMSPRVNIYLKTPNNESEMVRCLDRHLLPGVAALLKLTDLST